MKEKIISLLTAKFKGARKDMLAQLARTLAMQATTEEQAQALVDSITEEQVTEFERETRANIDKEVANSQKTFETTLKKKFDLVEKKKDGDPDKGEPDKPINTPAPPKSDDEAPPKWAQQIIDSNKKLSDELGAMKAGETRKSRKSTLEQALEGVPEKVKAKMLKDFDVMSFATDEDFNSYIEATKTDVADIVQDLANQGLAQTVTPQKGDGQQTREASEKECDAIVENFNI